MITVTVEAQLPDDAAAEAYLLWVRTFDREHANCHFRITSIGGDKPMDEIVAMLQRLGLTIIYAGRKQ